MQYKIPVCAMSLGLNGKNTEYMTAALTSEKMSNAEPSMYIFELSVAVNRT